MVCSVNSKLWTSLPQRIGLIAGNGKFPFLVLDAARSQGMQVVVAAIKEEASPEIEQRGAAAVHWLSLGELSKLIETFKSEGISRAIMAGQVKHKRIFSSIKPDRRLAQLLLTLATRNTDSLIGAVAKVLADEGITLMSSTALLEPMLATEGVMTRRGPNDTEQTNITYGRAVAHHLSRFDIGQTVVIADAACVAVEAMEGTDAAILRAGEIMRSPSLGKEPSTLSRALTVVKVAKPNQDMRFDVPVDRVADHRNHEAGRSNLPRGGCRALPHLRQARRDCRRRRGRYLYRRRNAGQPHSAP